MSTAKATVRKLLDERPDDASLEDLRYHMYTMSTQEWVGRSIRALVLCLLVIGCSSSGQKLTGSGGQNGTGGQGGGGDSPTTQVTLTFGQTIDNKVDILFVINDNGSVTANQQKLMAQLPTFLSVLKSGPIPLDLHIAVTTTDMGAPSDAQLVGCTPPGDDGQFRSAPEGTCTSTTLAAGATPR